MEQIKKFVNYLKTHDYYPDFHEISSGVNEPICRINGEEYLMFASNNYLSLTEDLDVKDAAKIAIDQYGVGPGGSRVISGNIDIIKKLESNISNLTMTEDCLTFPTGYMANVAAFVALLTPFMMGMPYTKEDSVVISDEFNHGSIVDGIKLANVDKVIFKHNDFDDLEKKLKLVSGKINKLVVTEGVFSLDGEITDMNQLIPVVKKYGAKLMIDDAHGVGVIGENGGGVVELFDCAKDVDVLMGCMDKAFGGTGGYLCGTKDMIDFLRISSRSSLLSSAIPTMMAGAMIKSVEKIKESGAVRRELSRKSRYLKDKLINNGFKILGNNDIPSVALFLGDENFGINFSKCLMEKRIYCPVVRTPAVPLGQSRLRIIIMNKHSYQDLDKFVLGCIYAKEKLNMK